MREDIRKIWRPLYDLGIKGQEQIDGQYMAMLISVATDETEALIASKEKAAVVEELKSLLEEMQWEHFDHVFVEDRLAELQADGGAL